MPKRPPAAPRTSHNHGEADVRTALRAYAQPSLLARNSLATSSWVRHHMHESGHADNLAHRAAAVRSLLDRGIDALQPADTRLPQHDKVWRVYFAMHRAYREQMETEQIAQGLYVSERTVYVDLREGCKQVADTVLSLMATAELVSAVTRLEEHPVVFMAPPVRAVQLACHTALLQLVPRAGELIAVSGGPAVGKTMALATWVALPAIRDAFPDGVLWANLAPTPQAEDILARWALALGLALPSLAQLRSTASRVQAMQDVLGGKRMLVVLEDASQVEHARGWMLGGPLCAHVVSTRAPAVALALRPDHEFALAPLDHADGALLLRAFLPADTEVDDASVIGLLNASHGLPMLIEQAAHHLARDRRFGHVYGREAAVAQIRVNPPEVAMDVAIVQRLQTSVAAMQIQAQEALAVLALFSDGQDSLGFAFAVELLRAAAEPAGAVTPRRVQDDIRCARQLQELVEFGWLRRVEGRYVIQPLMGQAFSERMAAKSRVAAVHGALSFSIANVADPIGVSAELKFIARALDLALSASMQHEACQLFCVFAPIALREGRAQPVLTALARLGELGKLPDPWPLQIGCIAAQAHGLLGNDAASLDAAQHALADATAGATNVTAHLHLMIGLAHLAGNNFHDAAAALQVALAHATEQKDVPMQIRIHNAWSTLALAGGDGVAAHGYASAAHTAATHIVDALGEAEALLRIGHALAFAPDQDGPAIAQCFERGIRLAAAWNHLPLQIAHLRGLSHARLTEGDIDGARALATQAMSVSRRIQAPVDLALSHALLARINAEQGEFAAAFAGLAQADLLASQVSSPQLTAEFVQLRGELYLQTGELEKARLLFDLASQTGSDIARGQARFGLLRVAHADANPEEMRAQLAAIKQLLAPHSGLLREVDAWHAANRI